MGEFIMKKRITRGLSILLSLVMVLSVISFPTIKPKAAAGTIDDFVERCYTVTLDRGSDPDGFADWKSQLTSGKAVGVHVAYGFLFSPEYTRKNKSNSAYVRDLYALFMGRDPDDSGYNNWMNQLDAGKSRQEVFAGFANSQEFYNICDSYGITAGRYVVGYDRYQINNVNLFVERLYKVCFKRRGDIGGQKDWVEKLLKKQITGAECARNFIQSAEYENLGLSDADYVENLYIALMGRASDAPGKADWLNGLANGMTRDEVFAGFVNSVEFDGICKKYNIERGSYTATKKGTYDPDNVTSHTHKYNQKNTDSKYLKSSATCTKAAVYYYSCECGEKGTSTFTSGKPKGHTYNKKNTSSKYLKSAATCTKAAVYYYSCECGEKDTTKTFSSGSPLGHNWDKGTVIKEATFTGKGSITYKCQRSGCNETKTEDILSELERSEPGDIIKFGKYEQDGDTTNGKEDIEWQVLSNEKGKVLVISKYALDCKQYHTESGKMTWEDCYLRKWLNQGFYNAAFSDSDKSQIASVTLKNNDLYFGRTGGNDTTDKVFCISYEEIKKYLKPHNYYDSYYEVIFNQKLMCTPTKYAINRGTNAFALIDSDYNNLVKNYGYTNDDHGRCVCEWWIRTPGTDDIGGTVSMDGSVGSRGGWGVTYNKIGVRPALYLKY
jgi:hypothetical protein